MRNETYTNAPIQHNALAYGIAKARYPGAWTEWDGQESIDQFLLRLHERPSVFVPDATGRRSGRWQSPGLDALHAIPFLYRGASQYLLGKYALHAMGLGEEVDPVQVTRDLHDRLDSMRSVFAAYGWNRMDGEFAEATTQISVADQKPWQSTEDVVADSDAEGARMTVSTSLESALDEFITGLTERGERLTNSQFTLVDLVGRELVEEHGDYDGWLGVALDTLRDPKDRKELKEKLATPGIKRFFAVNKVYRALVKARRQLAMAVDRLEADKDRATRYAQRPASEQYAGGEPEMIQLGRIDWVMADDDTTGLDGYDRGERYDEAIEVASSELVDLDELLDTLEAEQRRLTPVWRVLNGRGAPYWYANQETFFTIDEKEEAEEERIKLRDQWIAARPMELKRQLDKKALEMLAELANFNE